MGGMLVPVEALEDYEPVDKAARAVETLFGVDPDFVDFCKSLYGDDVDPVDVWLDVYKMNPTGPDLQTPSAPRKRGRLVRKADKDRRDRMAVAAASGVGAVAGGLGFARGVKGARAARALGKPVSRLDKGLLVVEPVGLGGEVGATHILGGDARRRKQQQPVDKHAIPSVHDMSHGIEDGMRGTLAPPTGETAEKIKPRKAKPVSGGAVTKAESVDVLWEGEFSKFDDDKRLVFGYASVVELNGMPVVDRQGDYIHPDDLENASYEYVLKSRVGGDMHRRDGEMPLKVSDLVESVVFTPEKIEKMGLPPEVAEKVPTSWWVGFKVHDDKAWDEVKKGHKAGFSIHGRGQRVPTSMDALVPGYA